MQVRHIPPSRWPIALALYAIAGFAFGFMPFQQTFTRLGIRPGYANLILVNLILPALAIAITIWYPRLWTAWLGAFILILGFILGRMTYLNPVFWTWTIYTFTDRTQPILVAAAVGCGILSTFARWIVGSLRQVGLPDAGDRCPSCDYLLTGLPIDRCPECGAGIPTDTPALRAGSD